ncbi:MAG: adenylyltransferase/cytidyltransferase family protein [Parasporobacterium sp.]|nr:adenylyltransferase/cytidyltransferase family protein [Parasporobacterium sp.]
MVKVITYGTYDLLHYGHIRLLERAKALGDYLIVGVTSDDFDKTRGKINCQQSLMERMEAVKSTGLADEIIVEEYEGQKIEDIRKYNIDIFTVGSDWKGHFDYLSEYCQVIYLPRTEGISSSELRNKNRKIQLGLIGDSYFLNKVEKESQYVNGIELTGVCTSDITKLSDNIHRLEYNSEKYEDILKVSDAVYIRSVPQLHYQQIRTALGKGKHVLCESPVCLTKKEYEELIHLANNNNLVLMEAIKTAYSTAFTRLLLLLKTGIIGDIVAVDATCTSLNSSSYIADLSWDGLFEWGPTALFAVFQILGINYKKQQTCVQLSDSDSFKTGFIVTTFVYEHAVATIRIGDRVKSEGTLIVSGTKGYLYVPAPWWNTDYFEIRYENPSHNKRYFYQLDGEGIRYELVSFAKTIETEKKIYSNIDSSVGIAISEYMDDVYNKRNVLYI